MDDPAFSLAHCRVAIIGLGLMGGSAALALRGQCAEIVGVDSNLDTVASALARSLIHRATDFESALACDLILLATPPRVILAQLESFPRHSVISHSSFVIDFGSTKFQITFAMESLPPRFDPIGGHPMCGKEVSGLENADGELFRDKIFVLTPLARTSPRALTMAHELIAALSARPLILTPQQNDALAALVSHLPYVAANALVRAALSAGDEQAWTMAASGFRDTTRLAASDLTMMTDILLTNRSAVLDALACFRAELDSLTRAIESGDPERLRAALTPAQSQRSLMFK